MHQLLRVSEGFAVLLLGVVPALARPILPAQDTPAAIVLADSDNKDVSYVACKQLTTVDSLQVVLRQDLLVLDLALNFGWSSAEKSAASFVGQRRVVRLPWRRVRASISDGTGSQLFQFEDPSIGPDHVSLSAKIKGDQAGQFFSQFKSPDIKLVLNLEVSFNCASAPADIQVEIRRDDLANSLKQELSTLGATINEKALDHIACSLLVSKVVSVTIDGNSVQIDQAHTVVSELAIARVIAMLKQEIFTEKAVGTASKPTDDKEPGFALFEWKSAALERAKTGSTQIHEKSSVLMEHWESISIPMASLKLAQFSDSFLEIK